MKDLSIVKQKHLTRMAKIPVELEAEACLNINDTETGPAESLQDNPGDGFQ